MSDTMSALDEAFERMARPASRPPAHSPRSRGLSAGLLVLKMTRQRIHGRLQAGTNATLMLTPQAPSTGMVAAPKHRAPVIIRSSASDDPCW